MVLNILRGIFILVILAALFVNLNAITTLQTDEIVSQEHRAINFWVIALCALALSIFVFLIDVLTPKKSLGALAGVFFGLLIGILISWALSPIVDMLGDTFRVTIVNKLTNESSKFR